MLKFPAGSAFVLDRSANLLGRNMRVREINHPADWHDLCLEFPHRAPDGGLMLNWPKVAEGWDGVNVTLGGMVPCD